MKLSRADGSRFAAWSFTVDHALLSAFAGLIALGVVLSFAASPAVAIKKGLPTYYFVERHLVFAALSGVVMLAISLLAPTSVRRLAAAILAAAFVGLGLVHAYGAEVNGAQRWLALAGHTLQPSEFAKPAFVVVMAWLFAEAAERRDVPAAPIAFAIWAALATLLVLQPDVGQTALISATGGALYVLAGLSLLGAAALIGIGGGGLYLAYQYFPHVRVRMDAFFGAASSENFQLDRAIQSFAEGGWLGRGPGEGAIKSVLPDAHTDFIFAVVGEEYGGIACLAIVAIYAFIVLRALFVAANEPYAANRLAVQGLATIFGLQALINMGVNIGLLPPKGMTLPFISVGGSSMLALAVTAGMLLALTRRRSDPQRLKKPRLVPTMDRFDLEEPNVQGARVKGDLRAQ
ncbi:MAG: FtsW/RodA/SpoVE family cell cycle protein [Hyphomicrobium sp.]